MSKISRSIVVAIFVALIAFLGVSDIVYINKYGVEANTGSNWLKLLYVVLIIVLVSLYTYVREKLSKLKLQKTIANAYKYVYITLVMIAATFFKIYNVLETYPKRTLLLYFILIYLIGLFTQKIIFNVSKSEVLSVLSMFVVFTMPNAVVDKTIDLNSKFISLLMITSIFVLQILLDELKQLNLKNRKYLVQAIIELKQLNLKNRKYLVQAIILGVLVGISTLVGINYLVWYAVALVSLFITSNLDSTSLNLSNRQNKTIKKRKNNYFIYKIERIKISKLFISLAIIFVISVVIYFGGRGIVRVLANHGNGVCQNIVNDLTVGVHTQKGFNIASLKDVVRDFSSMSTRYYMFCYVYIIFMEILSVVLHRKYDTKSTVIKLLFILIIGSATMFKLNVVYFQPLLTILLNIICIVDTTNIYYNREERIKMIEA